MKASKLLDTLIEESRKARDEAGRSLAVDRRNQQRSASQLDTLQHYKQEYHRKLHDALMQGLDAGALDNYQRFIHSLDDAIGSADQRLQQHSQDVTASQQRWRQRQQKLTSFDTLASRRAEQLRVAQSRQELRRSDELTSNAQARQRSGAGKH